MRYTQGYTMLELLVALAIVGILAALAVPSFDDTIERNGRESAMRDLVSSLSFARAEAVTRAASVSACRSIDQASCAAVGGADWNDGWIVFSDSGTAGVVDGTDELLRVEGDLPGRAVITLNNDDDTNVAGEYLRFTSEGFLDNDATSPQLYFKFCAKDADTGKSRAIWLAPTGRASMSVPDADGIHDDVLGVDLVCS